MGPVTASEGECGRPLPGDDLVPQPAVVMDRGIGVPAPPEAVWPWLVQLGKRRAGWYFPRSVERVIPPSRRAIRHLDERWQALAVGDVIPDYGGPSETFTVERIEAPRLIVYSSQRGAARISWVLHLTDDGDGTRVHLRLRIGPLKHPWLADTVGDWFDLATIAGMAAGLRERVTPRGQSR